MKYVPNAQLTTTEVSIDLSFVYDKEVKFNIQQPIGIEHLVLDASHTLIGYTHEPIHNGEYYHPHPATDFVILGQLYDEDGQTLPLLIQSHLLGCVIS